MVDGADGRSGHRQDHDSGEAVGNARKRFGESIGKLASPIREGNADSVVTASHKSQGSQAKEVTVLMPPEDSRLLTRELFYTAVSRAKEKIRVVGAAAAVRGAVERRAVRASGLGRRLRDGPVTAKAVSKL